MLENYLPFFLFVVAMTGTPGPGNLTMMAIGQTTGFRSAMPFLMGLVVGRIPMDLLVVCGLGELFTASPVAATIMKFLGSAYILYLAVKVLMIQAAPQKIDKRFTFVEGLFLHPLSPKSWAMMIFGFSQFVDSTAPLTPQIIVFLASFMGGLIVFHSSWCAAGALIPRFVQSRRTLFCVNIAMVTLMVGATGYAMFS
ncbi:MAG: LysE family translocator [Desulfobacteraceae bacterium]|nr:LysE family translocator [Desulfobacteraceae bacterium]